MINIIDLNASAPYKNIKKLYEKAFKLKQKNIDAMLVASFDSKKNCPDARFINLKYIHGSNFIFFSNYNSPKARQFESNNRISSVIFWNKINIQIRMQGKILKTDHKFNQKYFKTRNINKNALSISSNQSNKIKNYDEVNKKYLDTLNNSKDLTVCPDHWGGFCFIPDYFEFWEGHESRINKREVFDKTDGVWKHSFLQP